MLSSALHNRPFVFKHRVSGMWTWYMLRPNGRGTSGRNFDNQLEAFENALMYITSKE